MSYNYHIDANLPAYYKICVRGRITHSWLDRFEDMAITSNVEADGTVVTTLVGELPDQAALVGVINSLHDLRLAVLCIVGMENCNAL